MSTITSSQGAFTSKDKYELAMAKRKITAQAARIAELESQLAAERDALLTSASEVVGMDVRIKELETALKFYANKGHWMTDGLGSEPVSHIDLDGGEIARRALEKK